MQVTYRVLTLLAAAALPWGVAAAPPDASDEFFDQGVVPELRIQLADKQVEKLRNDPRHYVECTLVEDGARTHKNVRVKLKGRAGSFREFDDRPALTVSMKKAAERFHGLEKFHLNNSVQDDSYLNELVASQICAEASYPAARVSHARVWLNERDLGLYVLKEGYDELFLARHFANPRGNLYDCGLGEDIDEPLDKDAGEGPDDRSDLKALVEACRVEDPPQRWALISERLDIDAFLTFVALERMLCHWDGYAQGHNNYRIYFHADDKRACFFPHGMDQILADSNYPVFEGAEGLVARVVLENPTWNEQYRARVEQLLPLFAPEKLRAKIGAGFARIKPAAEKIGADFARELEERAGEFQERIALRQERILHPAPPEPIAFNDEGWAQIEGWEPRCDDDATLEERKRDERDCLAIEVGPSKQTTASFRTTALLAKGSYRLSAKVKTINVAAVVDDRGPGGAGVRISGVPRKNRAIGSADWRTVSHPFQIEEELQAVELIAELRASSGSAYFETDALRIYKVE